MTNSFQLPALTLDDIYQGLQDLKQNSSNRELHHVINKPQYQGIYKAILSFSKEELESYTYRFYTEDVLISESIYNDNILAFAALLQKGLYHDKLHPYSRWLMDNNTFHAWKFYDAMICIESLKNHYQKYNYINMMDLFFSEFQNLLRHIKNNDIKKDLTERFVLDYGNELPALSLFLFKHIDVNYFWNLNMNHLHVSLQKNKNLESIKKTEMDQIGNILKMSDSVFSNNKNDFINQFIQSYFISHRDQILNYLINLSMNDGNEKIFSTFIEHIKKQNDENFEHDLVDHLVDFYTGTSLSHLNLHRESKQKIEILVNLGYQFSEPEVLTQKFLDLSYIKQPFYRFLLAYIRQIVCVDMPSHEKSYWLDLHYNATNLSDMNSIFLKKQLDSNLEHKTITSKNKI